MKILINTGDELMEINGETFIPREWIHVRDNFDTGSYPSIKTAETILGEKLSLIKDDASKDEIMDIVGEQKILSWVNGILGE